MIVNKLVARDYIAGFGWPPPSRYPSSTRLSRCILVYHLENTFPLVTDKAPFNLDTDRVIISVSGHQRDLAGNLEKRQLILQCELSGVLEGYF